MSALDHEALAFAAAARAHVAIVLDAELEHLDTARATAAAAADHGPLSRSGQRASDLQRRKAISSVRLARP